MSRRGQTVLVAAVVIAVAVVPMVLAYLQLGYHADVRAGGPHEDYAGDATRVLLRGVADVSRPIPGEYSWSRRGDAVSAVRDGLAPRISVVETARIRDGVHRNVTYNRTVASRWAGANCPSGPDRQFGRCEAIDGVVVQDRAGSTHVLGVAFDVRTTGERTRTRLSTVIRAVR